MGAREADAAPEDKGVLVIVTETCMSVPVQQVLDLKVHGHLHNKTSCML